jgi:hypothetical protein
MRGARMASKEQHVEPSGYRVELDPEERAREVKRWERAHEAKQRDEGRIRRFEEVQRRKGRWIKFAEIAEWFSELGGHGPNEAAREKAFTMLQEDLLRGHFGQGDDSQVLFLFPGVSLTRRMTQQWLEDAIKHDYDNQHGRLWLENCWLPRNLFERWCAWHHLPKSPPRFEPQESHGVDKSEHRTQRSNRGGRPPKVDWDALKDALEEEIKNHGYPDSQNPPGWRQTKDVVEWADTKLGKESQNVARRTIEDNVRKMLREIKDSAKPVSR